MLREIDGNTIRNTGATHPTETGKQPTSLAVRVRVARVELVIDLVVAELELDREAVEVALQVAGIDPVVAERGRDPVVELAHDQLAGELARAPVGVELAHDQAVVERVRVPVEAVLEHVQVAAELEHVRAAVPLRIKWVIAPHLRGLVPVLGAADLAAEVEITREPAAAEAVIAWEVAE